MTPRVVVAALVAGGGWWLWNDQWRDRAPVGVAGAPYGVSKNLWARLTLLGRPTTVVGVHFLAQPDNPERRPRRDAASTEGSDGSSQPRRRRRRTRGGAGETSAAD